MAVITQHLSLASKGNGEMIDITTPLSDMTSASGITNGTVTIFVPGATGALTTIEYEPGLLQDMPELWEKLVPSSKKYQHDRTWGDGNGHSHLRASLLGPSLVVPVVNSELTLGTWQQVIFVDFDVRARSRELVIQFMGE